MNKKQKNKKAIVCCTNDLSTDKRVHRTCLSLKECSYDVTLVGCTINKSEKIIRNYKTFRLKMFFKRKFLFYAEYNIKLIFYLLYKKPYLIISNDLDTLPACYLSSRILKCKLIYDSHELFTEVPELNKRKFVKKIWKCIEKKIVPKLKTCITVNESIAKLYEHLYNVNFHVVRNLPERKEIKYIYDFTKDFKNLSNSKMFFLLYQGALNIGRGIDKLIKTIKILPDNYFLVIIGDGYLKNELELLVKKLNLSNRIKFYGKIPIENLENYIAGATIGFSLIENLSKSYYYCLPNKIFDYINCHIPVICSDLPEQKKIVENYKIGISVSTKINENSLAKIIYELTNNEDLYNFYKENTILASKTLSWNYEKQKLLSIINSINT